jgi:hypothetical protein
MANLILNGSTSGSVTLSSPAVSGTTTLTLPTTSGTVVTTATGQTLTSPVIAGTPTGVGVLTSGTSVASTSGTSIDFTGIPSWVKRITVMFSGMSTSGTSSHLVQLGTSGGIQATGYVGGACRLFQTLSIAVNNFTTGFGDNSDASATLYHGPIIINNVSGNIWVASGNIGHSVNTFSVLAGGVTLSGTLDRVRITTVNGTDTFDAGSINILYE